jgi:hypothetical protein
VRRYESILVPAIRLLADVILDRLEIGDSFEPGVRDLARWAGLASAGQISPMLYELAGDGWIAYDGRTITLLANPDEPPISDVDRGDDEPPINAADRAESPPINAADRPNGTPINAVDRPINRADRATSADSINTADRGADRVPKRNKAFQAPINGVDRISKRMEDHVLVAAAGSQDSPAALKHDLPCEAKNDQSDRSLDPVVQRLLELDPVNDGVVANILADQPNLTLQQVNDTWADFAPRIKLGYCTPGAFFKALRAGEFRSAPSDPQRPIAAEEYTRRDPGFYRRGDDVSDLEPAEQAEQAEQARGAAAPPPLASDDQEAAFNHAYQRARSLAPPGTPHAAMTTLIYALLDGATDDQALDLLAQETAS